MVDSVSLEVISNALLSIAEEAGETLVRAAYSSNIKERRDCSTAIFDSRGRLVALAQHIPVHFGSMLGLVQEVLRRYGPEDLHPGDMFIANDPYCGGGTHLPDITLASPVFADNRLVGFVANIGHHADRRSWATSIFEEGLRIPPIKLLSNYSIRQDVLDLVLTNYRVPHQRLGDLRAQIAANLLAEQRLLQLIRKYGYPLVTECMDGYLKYSARRMQAALQALPDGCWESQDQLDDDGVSDEPVVIRVRVMKSGGMLKFDFSGSSPQREGNINMVWNALVAMVYYCVKAFLDPELPQNAGVFDCIEIVAPPGTVVNALPPAAVDSRTETCQRVADVILEALGQARPERAVAMSHGTNTTINLSGIHPDTGEFYSYLETFGGGSGARSNKDGMDAVQVHATNSSNLPVECLELEYPILIERYELVPDSGGAGKYRGGLGLRRDLRILAPEVVLTGHGDRHKTAPRGLHGGRGGATSWLRVQRADGTIEILPSKPKRVVLRKGDLLSVVTPGGGGFGNPLERDRRLVLKDLTEGRITAACAATDYGLAREEVVEDQFAETYAKREVE